MYVIQASPCIEFNSEDDMNVFVAELKKKYEITDARNESDKSGALHVHKLLGRDALYIQYAKEFHLRIQQNIHRYTRGEDVCVNYKELIGTGKYFSKASLLDSTESGIKYAENSELHNKIMADGNVFNPYIHRRFLPSQYLELIRAVSGDDRHMFDAFRRRYSAKYALRYIDKEVGKLSLLSKIDVKTFRERARFFTFSVVYDFIEVACSRMWDGMMYGFWDNGFGTYRTRDRNPDFEYKYKNLLDKIKKCNGYSNLYDVLNEDEIYQTLMKSDFLNRYDCSISNMFITAFIASGAFYTMKHLVMFEGYLTHEGETQAEAMKNVTGMIKFSGNWMEMHHLLMDLIKRDIRKPA